MDAATVLSRLARDDRGRLLAALVARTGDWAAAEEALQDAFAAAVTGWQAGVPDRPDGWLLRTALRRAIDGWRSRGRAEAGMAALARLGPPEAGEEAEMIPDERLRLIFTCCHPALDRKSQVALTLRAIGGLTTPEIAAAFLDEPATMGQRISRAKSKIGAAGIPFTVPGPELWPERLQSVLATIYLIFTAGYVQGGTRDLGDEAVFLADLLNALRPGEPEVEGCLALLLLTHARRRARTGPDGATVPPAMQDRRLWDHTAIARGVALQDRAMARGRAGPYQIKAAIAALHCANGPTDWAQIAALYGALAVHEPSSVVALNRAVAIAEAGQPLAALVQLDKLAETLGDHQPLHAARAMVLARLGHPEARDAYDRAIASAPTGADARFLIRQRDAVTG